MTDSNILFQLPLFPETGLAAQPAEKQPNLHTFWQYPDQLPSFVTASPAVMRCLELLGRLDWGNFPERNLRRNWGQTTIPYAALAAAELIKLNEGLDSLARLYHYLIEHPGLIWLLGFPLYPAPNDPLSFNSRTSLPTQRHLTRMLRHLPKSALQFLLADSVRLIQTELTARGMPCGECISLDTKHIVAWVKQNNPKAYVADRFNKDKQPAGDPDCRLGCKRRRNLSTVAANATVAVSQPSTSTPTRNSVPASQVSVGEYYWGYGSGIVVTRVPPFGEFVLSKCSKEVTRKRATELIATLSRYHS